MATETHCIPLLPSFVRPIPDNLDPVTLEYLLKTNTFVLPSKNVLAALIESYFDYVNPLLPLFDRVELMRQLELGPECHPTKHEDQKLSLLVIQALLFAGSNFVDMSMIQAMGFEDRQMCRKSLFLKARFLYDFDTEPDGTSLLQSLLLFTYWVEIGDNRGPWHWICAAISYAQTIDLRGLIEQSAVPPEQYRALRRLWWCCRTRETIIAVSMKKCAPTLQPNESDMPMLSLEDICPPSDGLRGASEDMRPNAVPPEKSRTQAMISIQMAKLGRCINRILWISYESDLIQRGRRARGGHDFGEGSSLAIGLQIRDCANHLNKWAMELPQEVRLASELDPNHDGTSDASLSVLRIILQMTYFAAIVDLYFLRSFEQRETPGTLSPLGSKLRNFYRRKSLSAVRQIERMVEVILRRDLAKYLPSSSLSVLVRVMMVYTLDHRSFRSNPGNGRPHGPSMCMSLLHALESIYPSAARFHHYFETKLRRLEAKESARRQSTPGLSNKGAIPRSTFSTATIDPQTALHVQSEASDSPPDHLDLLQTHVEPMGNSRDRISPSIESNNALGRDNPSQRDSVHALTATGLPSSGITPMMSPNVTGDGGGNMAWTSSNLESLERYLLDQLSSAIYRSEELNLLTTDIDNRERGEGLSWGDGADIVMESPDADYGAWSQYQQGSFVF